MGRLNESVNVRAERSVGDDDIGSISRGAVRQEITGEERIPGISS